MVNDILVDDSFMQRRDHSVHKDDSGQKSLDLPKALAVLLLNDVVTLGTPDTGFNLIVPCTNMFFIGCFDYQFVNFSDIEILYRFWLLDNKWGPLVWICHKTGKKFNVVANHALSKAGWNLTEFWLGADEDKLKALIDRTYHIEGNAQPFYVKPE